MYPKIRETQAFKHWPNIVNTPERLIEKGWDELFFLSYYTPQELKAEKKLENTVLWVNRNLTEALSVASHSSCNLKEPLKS